MPFFDGYPYTNLHNVNLDWVLQKVKAWGEMVEQNNQNFIDLQAANESFKEYVTGYITNLDVQEEINNKLDDMLASGALTQYFSPYIKADVEDWLEENITPTTPPVDATLSIAGAAADAKVTGDYVRSFDASITDLEAEVEELRNHGGLSTLAIESLVTILRSGLYESDMSDEINTLYNELMGGVWNYIYTYDLGLLENNGYSKTGTGTEELTASGNVLQSSAIYILNPSTYNNSGEVEAVGSVQTFGTAVTSMLRLAVSNGTNGSQVFIGTIGSSTGIFVDNGTYTSGVITINNLTFIKTLEVNELFTVKMSSDANGVRVFVNGEKLYEDIRHSSGSCTANRLMVQGGTFTLQSLKWGVR